MSTAGKEGTDRVNKAIFIGNLTRDPETKMMTNGKPRTTFSLAVNRPYVDRNGQRGADFISFTAYDSTAELAEKYLAKGRKVGIEAHVRTGRYEKDGRTIYTTEFIVERIEFLSSAQGGETASAEAPADDQSAEGGYDADDDDHLPF